MIGWAIVSLILIVVGLFIWTQGAGPGVASTGGIIAVVLLIVTTIT